MAPASSHDGVLDGASRGERGRGMLMMVRPRARDGTADAKAEQLQLVCAFCGKAFTSLHEAFLAYTPPQVNQPVEPRWCHKRCAQRQRPRPTLWRGDFAMKALISSLVTPAPVPRVPVTQLNRTKRPWGRP